MVGCGSRHSKKKKTAMENKQLSEPGETISKQHIHTHTHIKNTIVNATPKNCLEI